MDVPPARVNVPCLDDSQIRTLVALGNLVETHYAQPMDLEWALANDNVYLLQARPSQPLILRRMRCCHPNCAHQQSQVLPPVQARTENTIVDVH